MKMFQGMMCRLKHLCEPLQARGWIRPLDCRPRTGIQIPRVLRYDPEADMLVMTDLGQVSTLESLFRPLRIQNLSDELQPLATRITQDQRASLATDCGPDLGLDGIMLQGCHIAFFFASIGQKLGTFLASLHEPCLRDVMLDSARATDGDKWASHHQEADEITKSIFRAKRRLMEHLKCLQGIDGEYERLANILIADNSRNDHPKE